MQFRFYLCLDAVGGGTYQWQVHCVTWLHNKVYHLTDKKYKNAVSCRAGQIAQLVRALSQYTKVAGLIPDQGT